MALPRTEFLVQEKFVPANKIGWVLNVSQLCLEKGEARGRQNS